jgi:hypothetical protein
MFSKPDLFPPGEKQERFPPILMSRVLITREYNKQLNIYSCSDILYHGTFLNKNLTVFYLKHISKLLLKAESNSRPRYPHLVLINPCSYPSSAPHSQGNPSTR